ncbi:MAG TPA: recombinase family protein [Acetobacteraceae bacterium]|nr:recombinase family protein [Acetobacteraceae bacterium]
MTETRPQNRYLGYATSAPTASAWRSPFDLFAIVKPAVDSKAQFRSLAEPRADTSTSTGRPTIAVLGGLADVERDLIPARTAEGRSRAKARGQHMGSRRNSRRSSRGKHGGGGPKAQRSMSWRKATTWAWLRFRV